MPETRQQLSILDMIGGVITGLAIIALLALNSLIPTFTAMFEELGSALPLPTVLVIQRWPLLIAVLGSGILLAVGAAGPGNPTLLQRRLAVLAGFVIASLTIVLTVAALYLPLFTLSAMVEEPNGGSDRIKVRLPRAAAGSAITGSVQIAIAGDGSVFYNGESVDRVALRERLIAQARVNPETHVVIAADEGVRHGTVVEVMDLARQAGLTRLGVLTGPPEEIEKPRPAPEP